MATFDHEEALRRLNRIQYSKFTYEHFLKVMKRRVRRWTGDNAAAFYSPEQLADELVRLGVFDSDGNVIR